MAMILEEAVDFLGYAADSEIFGKYLDTLNIKERPQFEENPSEWIARNDEGYIFIFEEKLFYKKNWGEVIGSGSMVFTKIRVHSKENNAGCTGYYSLPLPAPLSFDQRRNDVISNIGHPSFDDEAARDENRLCTWHNIHLGKANISLSIVFLPDDGNISFLTITPVKLKFL